MALGFGLLPSKVDQIGASDYILLQRYWQQEPWGPLRDNFHAALVTAKIHNMLRGKRGKAAKLDDFMIVDREEHQAKSKANLVNYLKAMGRKRG